MKFHGLDEMSPIPSLAGQAVSAGRPASAGALPDLAGAGVGGGGVCFVLREPSADMMMATKACLGRANERLRCSPATEPRCSDALNTP